MTTISRRQAIRGFALGGGVFGAAIAGGYLVPQLISALRGATAQTGGMMGGGMMNGSMMGSVTAADMATYMDMFARHHEIRRTVEQIPGGVRTTTESDAPDLAVQLQTHVSNMYRHLDQRAEVSCMSPSLPVLFANANVYQRQLILTTKGVTVTETSSDLELTNAVREHAQEVTGFVRDGMTAMMRGMMSG
jgi:hypothetical protein